MASVTRRSRDKGESRESADCKLAYVSGVLGVVFAARVRRVRRRSLCCCDSDSVGRVEARAVCGGVLVSAVLRCGGMSKDTLVFGPCAPGK
jgi:hypothetical protein